MLKAGFSRLDITPPMGVRLAGYYYERLAEGVNDPLYVNGLAFSDGERTAVVLSCDLLGIYNNEAREWPRQIAAEIGLPLDAMFISHIHTHTGPVVCGAREPSDPQYDAWLYRRLKDAAAIAIRDLKPITSIRTAEGDCKGVAFVRRYKMKDGRFQTWGHYIDPDIVAYASEPDETLRLVRIAREGGDELALVNFQLHPDTQAGNLVSADWPYFLRERVEAAHPGTKMVFLDGAEGQMSDCDGWHASVPTRLGYEKTRLIGNKIADCVLGMYDDVKMVEGEGVKFGQKVPVCKTKWSKEKRDELMAEAERLIYIHEHGNELEEIGPDWVATPLVAEAYQLRRLDAAQLSEVPMTVSAVTVGGLAFLGIPGEPFCEIGLHIRQQSPYPVTFVCCQTNGCEGYYPTAEAYDQGGYEPRNTRFPKGIGEILMDTADELLKTL